MHDRRPHQAWQCGRRKNAGRMQIACNPHPLYQARTKNGQCRRFNPHCSGTARQKNKHLPRGNSLLSTWENFQKCHFFVAAWLTGGRANFMRGLLCQGKFPKGKISPPSQISKFAVPRTHCGAQAPRFRQRKLSPPSLETKFFQEIIHLLPPALQGQSITTKKGTTGLGPLQVPQAGWSHLPKHVQPLPDPGAFQG